MSEIVFYALSGESPLVRRVRLSNLSVKLWMFDFGCLTNKLGMKGEFEWKSVSRLPVIVRVRLIDLLSVGVHSVAYFGQRLYYIIRIFV